MLSPYKSHETDLPRARDCYVELPFEGTEGKSMGSLKGRMVALLQCWKGLTGKSRHELFQPEACDASIKGRNHSALLRGVWWQGPECRAIKSRLYEEQEQMLTLICSLDVQDPKGTFTPLMTLLEPSTD